MDGGGATDHGDDCSADAFVRALEDMKSVREGHALAFGEPLIGPDGATRADLVETAVMMSSLLNACKAVAAASQAPGADAEVATAAVLTGEGGGEEGGEGGGEGGIDSGGGAAHAGDDVVPAEQDVAFDPRDDGYA